MSEWLTYGDVTPASVVNHMWQPAGAELTRLLGDGWRVEMQHQRGCDSHHLAYAVRCPRELRYRAELVAPIHARASSYAPIHAYNNLIWALA